MTAFSRAQSKLDAIATKQRRARVQSKLAMPDFKALHPGWCRDANAENPNYTLINKEIKEACEKLQKRQETFTRKLHEH